MVKKMYLLSFFFCINYYSFTRSQTTISLLKVVQTGQQVIRESSPVQEDFFKTETSHGFTTFFSFTL